MNFFKMWLVESVEGLFFCEFPIFRNSLALLFRFSRDRLRARVVGTQQYAQSKVGVELELKFKAECSSIF